MYYRTSPKVRVRVRVRVRVYWSEGYHPVVTSDVTPII
jgi:hypothetical protein